MSAIDNRCAFCGVLLTERVLFFCSTCWWRLPAPERSSLVRLHAQSRDVDSKIAKCVRLLREQTPKHVEFRQEFQQVPWEPTIKLEIPVEASREQPHHTLKTKFPCPR